MSLPPITRLVNEELAAGFILATVFQQEKGEIKFDNILDVLKYAQNISISKCKSIFKKTKNNLWDILQAPR